MSVMVVGLMCGIATLFGFICGLALKQREVDRLAVVIADIRFQAETLAARVKEGRSGKA